MEDRPVEICLEYEIAQSQSLNSAAETLQTTEIVKYLMRTKNSSAKDSITYISINKMFNKEYINPEEHEHLEGLIGAFKHALQKHNNGIDRG